MRIPQQTRTLVYNSNRLSVPECRRRVAICTSELPTCLVKQVTKLGDRAFCAVEEPHHLRCAKNQLGHPCKIEFTISYIQVDIIYHGRATEIGEQWPRWWSEFCAGDLVRGRFVTGICHQQVNTDELGLGASSSAQIFQYFEAIFVGPVVEHFAQKEGRDVLLLRGLRVKEVLTFRIRRQSGPRRVEDDIHQPWNFTRPDSIAPGRLFFQNCGQYVFRHKQYSDRSANSMHIRQHLPVQQIQGLGRRSEVAGDA